MEQESPSAQTWPQEQMRVGNPKIRNQMWRIPEWASVRGADLPHRGFTASHEVRDRR